MEGQFWRLISSFLYFGNFSLDFFFHLYFIIRYSKLLEEGSFRNRTADYIFMLLFCAGIILLFAFSFSAFARIKFLGHPLAFTMTYVWGRAPENANVRMALFGLFQFNAPYLSWALLLFSLFIGNPIETDLLGILAGHIYYFFAFVYPHVADRRCWKVRKILQTPQILHYLCGTGAHNIQVVGVDNNNNRRQE